MLKELEVAVVGENEKEKLEAKEMKEEKIYVEEKIQDQDGEGGKRNKEHVEGRKGEVEGRKRYEGVEGRKRKDGEMDSKKKGKKAKSNFKETNEKFQFGNYSQYYGYRNPGSAQDSRLQHFQAEWFLGKEVLDIGCNIGHITISIAKHHAPSKIVGLDIDRKLIEIAKKNVRFYRDTRWHIFTAQRYKYCFRNKQILSSPPPGPTPPPSIQGGIFIFKKVTKYDLLGF